MPINSDPRQIKSTMNDISLRFKKRFGQNFLCDVNYINRIADCSGDTEYVLEIGPGLGNLTSALAVRHSKVISVEIDKDIYEYLNETFGEYDNVKIINSDFMEVNLPDLIKEEFNDNPISVTANIPYYITTPIILKLTEQSEFISKITILIQKEVALRLTAQPGTKDYGAITAYLNYFGTVKKEFTVPHSVFMPPPKVDSAVITVDFYKDKPFKAKDEKLLEKFIRGGFAKRRKTLINSLLFEFGNDKKDILLKSIDLCGINPLSRGETLSIKDYVALSDSYLSLTR